MWNDLSFDVRSFSPDSWGPSWGLTWEAAQDDIFGNNIPGALAQRRPAPPKHLPFNEDEDTSLLIALGVI